MTLKKSFVNTMVLLIIVAVCYYFGYGCYEIYMLYPPPVTKMQPHPLAIYIAEVIAFAPYILLIFSYIYISMKVFEEDKEPGPTILYAYTMKQGILFAFFSVFIFISHPLSDIFREYYHQGMTNSIRFRIGHELFLFFVLSILTITAGLCFKKKYGLKEKRSANVMNGCKDPDSRLQDSHEDFFSISKFIIIALMEKLEIFLFIRLVKGSFKPFSIIQSFLKTDRPKFKEIVLLYFSSVTLLNGYLLAINNFWKKIGYPIDILNTSLAKSNLSTLLLLTLISFLSLLLVMVLPQKIYGKYGKLRFFSASVLYNIYITIYLAIIISLFPIFSLITGGHGNYIVYLLITGIFISQIYLHRRYLKLGWVPIFVLLILGGYLQLQVINIKKHFFM